MKKSMNYSNTPSVPFMYISWHLNQAPLIFGLNFVKKSAAYTWTFTVISNKIFVSYFD